MLLGRRQSQQSNLAKAIVMSAAASQPGSDAQPQQNGTESDKKAQDTATLRPKASRTKSSEDSDPAPAPKHLGARPAKEFLALNDTPATTAPSSPSILPRRQHSGDKIGRAKATTLDIPGLTKSRVSPDGKIAPRDVGSKLVIVMVGLPARGKSYITKKVARYLNWLQHDTRIFNVGERRRTAASNVISNPASPRSPAKSLHRPNLSIDSVSGEINPQYPIDPPRLAAEILLSGEKKSRQPASPEDISTLINGDKIKPPTSVPLPELHLPEAQKDISSPEVQEEGMDQSASFFDPKNARASLIREQVALETLDELLDYILVQGGAVGILDATNSTVSRRRMIINHIREKAGPDLNVLFMESICLDKNLLERNMRLKLSGPDYKHKDPEKSLQDFKKRVEIYQDNYVPIGEYEEQNNLSYVQMIDVGRKVISHQIKGFLSAQTVYYLLNFNLAPRQIWITRHGESEDNLSGRLGGDSPLTPLGRRFAKALAFFLQGERKLWEVRELEKERRTRLPPKAGDSTPPNPHYFVHEAEEHILHKNFCVWTSMLKRSIETAEYFDEEHFEVKQMRMLNELNAGTYEGWTYDEMKTDNREEFEARRQNKLEYRYPGPGGEGYLDVINRLRPVIVELERMTDHALLIGHRSVARILLAYFLGLGRSEVTNLDVPIGMLYCLEPKPYGVDFKAYRWNPDTEEFGLQPGYKLQQTQSQTA